VEALKVDDTPRATSKNLDVLKEFEKLEKKKEANFVVIGNGIKPTLRIEINIHRPC
jgi:elongation factor 1 alpha-like protein